MLYMNAYCILHMVHSVYIFVFGYYTYNIVYRYTIFIVYSLHIHPSLCTDTSEPTSLAHEIRSQTPPVVVTITRPMRVELVGEELRVYRRSEEMRRREEEEVAYRRKRQDELAMVYIIYTIYTTRI